MLKLYILCSLHHAQHTHSVEPWNKPTIPIILQFMLFSIITYAFAFYTAATHYIMYVENHLPTTLKYFIIHNLIHCTVLITYIMFSFSFTFKFNLYLWWMYQLHCSWLFHTIVYVSYVSWNKMIKRLLPTINELRVLYIVPI